MRAGFASLFFLVQVYLSPSVVFATDSNAEFEMEVQERMTASQISSVRKKHGACNRYEITYWDHLASQYLSHGMESEAERTYYRLLRECVELKKIYHPDTLAVAGSLLGFYHNQLTPDKAENLNSTILSSSEKELGKDDLSLIPVLDHLSQYYENIGQQDKIEEMLQRALHIAEQSNRSTRLDIAQRQLLLANMYFSQKRAVEAESLYQKSTPIIFAEHSRFDEMVLGIRERMVNLFTAMEKWAEAEPHMNELVAYLAERTEETHPVYIRSLGHLAVIYANQGKYDAAKTTFTKAIMHAENGGEKTLELLETLQKSERELIEWMKSAVTKSPEQCTESQARLLYELTMQWNDLLESVISRVDKLSTKIEQDDQLARNLKRSNPEYNKLFVQYLGYQNETWGESTLTKTCLAELSEYEQDIERYLKDGQMLYESWGNVYAFCNEQGNEELAERASRFREHHYDASFNVAMLRQEKLDVLSEDCTDRKEWDDEFESFFSEDDEGEGAGDLP